MPELTPVRDLADLDTLDPDQCALGYAAALRGEPAEECPDGPRYKAIGNSKAIPVVRWIGRRLMVQLG
ncbi:TPA: hypothetical protein ACUT5J_001518 [Pseudomonas aeruginosa]|uniref:hypothetical protein n=1 Tax=Pseudomonas TaxID=286 RepID=UPI0002EA9E17|nr:hypothetical protein [Pseudomonas aeruginosa]EKU2298539.1 hypothetical protein [Pseudomonas aeruginosa]EKU2327765.1 hypothetical protein [Pseudomonas aeruginosa]KPE48688.1 hypothetical protein AOA76_01335 [Pseudomonas aeruginosa]MDP5547215.1 hypothetical protein [Pseudomonas aeruginosa]MDP5823025.1 hypothetical protein [Pseudomonas aeruginosa]